MKLLQFSDYRIYFDDVQMDPYIKNWTGSCGLRASDATASITMYRTKRLEMWKGYLTQVRIFARNVFSGKYGIIFEGEIVNRTWGDQRIDVGEIIFHCKGFYHWLDIPIPFLLSYDDEINHVQRFKYEAMNIDVDAVLQIQQSREQLLMKGLTVKMMIEEMFDKISAGYNLNEDSSFFWAQLKTRFKVMGDIYKEFRDAGWLDSVTFVRTTQIDTFYVYLNQVLTQLMFEFYQDRDGSFRVKNPSWKDSILKAHVIDESIVQNVNGFNDWENEPTRVLVIGGHQDLSRNLIKDNVLKIPMGLYVGLPGEGQYFSQVVEALLQEYGVSNPDAYTGGGGPFFDDISGNYTITSPFGMRDGEMHRGTDYGMSYKPLHNLGVSGEVIFVGKNNPTAGNWIQIRENINGQDYVFVYMHLSQINVKKGDIVSPGQQIGVTGNTGDSSGPHLHLEIWKGSTREGGTAIDPAAFLKEMKEKQDYGSGTVTGGMTPGSGTIEQYMNMNLGNPGNISADFLNSFMNKYAKSSASSKMYNQGQAFYQAGVQSGLNPIYIVAHAAHETGWGTSRIVRDKNNFFGIGAYDRSPYASAYSYSSVQDGIVAGAKWIRKNYYDRGQNTLWKMVNSSDGHNYATDRNWPNAIAKIMQMSGMKPGATTSGVSAPAPTDSNSTPYTSSPNSLTGGLGYTTRYTNPKVTTDYRDPLGVGSGSQQTEQKAVPYYSFNSYNLKYTIPNSANSYKSSITNRPNGVNPNMICCIIEIASQWREKYSTSTRYGLMGVHKNYITANLGAGKESVMFNPIENIEHGTKLFSQAYSRFTSKATFALAALYEGGMGKVEEYIEKAGVEDFSKVRSVMASSTVAFVDAVIGKFTELFGGTYLTGDPHKPIAGTAPGGSPVVSPEVKDYESNYKPMLSDEERQYKLNLKISEQLLIRYDTPGVGGGEMDADALIERYAKYMMQLFRAESHGVTVNLSACMPFLRPGFNAWLEPTRRDLVFYITKVSHQGSFGNGCFSSVTGGFVREPSNYDDIEDNIFIGSTNAKASDFGEVIAKGEMDALRTELKAMHDSSDEVIGDAKSVTVLSKLYSSAVGKETEYTTMWNNEFTPNEIAEKIKGLYGSAPKVVQSRKAELQNIVTESADFFVQKLLHTKF